MAKQTEIAYEPTKEWADFQTGGTRIDAADLNNMEKGIADACAAADELRTRRLPTYVVLEGGDAATQDAYAEPILGPCLILDLATRTTYYESGGDEEGHRKAITSGADIDAIRDSLSHAATAYMEFEPYEVNVASHDFRAAMLPGGAVMAKIVWTLATEVPAGIWHKVGVISGAGLGIVSRCVEATGNDAAYFACSVGTNMCTVCVKPDGEVMANPVTRLLAGFSGVAQMRFTPLPL